ncbi:formylglycine-generating enzyme family protein [Cellvibrio sp. QJXJ]|uniref:formylglycine-generating enzyme family protein n=1 Tax=Cellvibrio sp. QJXJ TaxID=2964606 RepID=UPI0021C33676|nr:formylglycine-generating enzyme family protein [Cellvibrio sp. QJXJ]UUA72447.1 formylglycine-generating enzyme family protein [Cellvibrio sp. QJXJ]
MSLVGFCLKRLPVLLIASQSHLLWAADGLIEPIMVDVPAGQLTLHPKTTTQKDGTVVSTGTQIATLPIKPFRMGKYEVTVKEFGQFIAATNYPAPTSCQQMDSQKWFAKRPGSWAKNKHSASEFEPVTCIGWDAAQAYVEWLSKETGRSYRLPSEVEWEYAARAGTTSTYFWGEEATQACAFANTADQAAEAAIKRDYDGLESKDHVGVLACDDKSGYASVVGIYQPNAFGLHDMIGNINEFTRDCANETYPGDAKDASARMTGDCTKRMIRGGSWHWAPFAMTQRSPWSIDFIGALEGFRIAEDMPNKDSCAKPSPEQRKRNKQFKRELSKAQKALRQVTRS